MKRLSATGSPASEGLPLQSPANKTEALTDGPAFEHGGYGILGDCLGWQNATPAPSGDPAPLPAVPTLILSGTGDVRTPNSDAATVAARIPGSRLVTVPNVGHSVLGTDQSGCAGG